MVTGAKDFFRVVYSYHVRRHCTPIELLAELKRSFHERTDLNLWPLELHQEAIYTFLVEWVELYWELDFKSATLRNDLISLIEELAPQERNKLKLLILRQAHPIVKRRLSSASAITRKAFLKSEETVAGEKQKERLPQSPVVDLKSLRSASSSPQRKSLTSWLSPSSEDNNAHRSILLNHKSEDIARQLTLIEFHMFENVSRISR